MDTKTLYDLPKDMLVKLIATIQEETLNLTPFLKYSEKLEKEQKAAKEYYLRNKKFPDKNKCEHKYCSPGDDFYTVCDRKCNENEYRCDIHSKLNILNLEYIKFLFEDYPHYFYSVVELISFISKYKQHPKDCSCGRDDCVTSDLYINKILNICSNLEVSVPLSIPKMRLPYLMQVEEI